MDTDTDRDTNMAVAAHKTVIFFISFLLSILAPDLGISPGNLCFLWLSFSTDHSHFPQEGQILLFVAYGSVWPFIDLSSLAASRSILLNFSA
jgi:hypothetical protein